MAEPEGFIARWSRRKNAARRRPGSPPSPAPAEPPPTPAAPQAEAAALPAIESLTAESDFSLFMQPGVPDDLRNAALQKLWRSDPVYANLDGLLEYGEDYAAAFASPAAVRTAYRVLQGMPGGEPAEKPAPEPAPGPVSQAEPSEAAAGQQAQPDGLPQRDELG
jgi:Protein of unknown function (DUF3306)